MLKCKVLGFVQPIVFLLYKYYELLPVVSHVKFLDYSLIKKIFTFALFDIYGLQWDFNTFMC